MPKTTVDNAEFLDNDRLVVMPDRDGNAVLVPLSEAAKENLKTYRSKSSGSSGKAIDRLLSDVREPYDEYKMKTAGEHYADKAPMSREQMVQRTERAGRNVSDVADQGYEQRMVEQERMRQRIGQAGRTISDIADQGYEQRQQPTPFTDVRRGISESLVREHPSQSDILSEADLRLADELRRRKLGI